MMREQTIVMKGKDGKQTKRYYYEHGNMRYLFRDDVLILKGDSLISIDVAAKKDDRLLICDWSHDPAKVTWQSYRMVMFIDDTWGWSPLPDKETTHLRALLLLQQ